MFGARYYGSSLGRFMTPDWAAKPTNVPYASFGNPQSLNLYSYVNNNPTTTRDPDGHCAEVVSCTLEFGAGGSIFGPVGTVVGALAGAAVGGAIVYYGGKAAINYFQSSNSNTSSSPPPGTQTGTQAGTQPKDVYIDPNKYPASAGP
jgi:RHS repeat-associated protein